MSPTSYQAAPPRRITLADVPRIVKRASDAPEFFAATGAGPRPNALQSDEATYRGESRGGLGNLRGTEWTRNGLGLTGWEAGNLGSGQGHSFRWGCFPLRSKKSREVT